MLLTVLSVPECPNVEVLLDRLREVLPGHAADLNVIVVEDDERARAWGMAGSPTLLVDGVDPFAVAGGEASVSCRLYRGADCTVGGAPPVADLRAVLSIDATPRREPARRGIDVVGRGGRGRRAPAEGGMRAVQQGVLCAIAGSGTPPEAAELDRIAAPFGRAGADVLRELAVGDYLSLDADGRPRAVYPFSVEVSRHRVQIEDGPTVWAMCAVDALGIAPMLGRAASIVSSDPITSEQIRVRVEPAAPAKAEPPGTVVYLAARSGGGPAERVCCDVINFFASPHSAARWAATQADMDGEIVALKDAAEIGYATFGGLLAE
jgi:hypothetical protein